MTPHVWMAFSGCLLCWRWVNIQEINLMKREFAVILFCAVLYAVAGCSKEPEETAEQTGSAEQVGKKIDEAVENLQQRALEAEANLGDKLIEAGKS
jgi:hypothetical protein